MSALATSNSPTVHKNLIQLSTIEAEDVQYVWPGRIARGKFQVLAGDPGLGKSFLSLDAAARATTGKLWPDGQAGCEPGNVVIWPAEDTPSDTIRPRVDALGGDSSRIYILDDDAFISLDTGYLILEEMLKDLHALLAFIDPMTAYLGNTDSYKDSSLRGRVLRPLGKVARITKAGIVGIMHLTKNDETDSLYRVGGSIGFVAAARLSHIVAPHPQWSKDDPPWRVFGPLKFNIGPEPPSLAYRIRPDLTIEWHTEPGISAKEALGQHAQTASPAPKEESKEAEALQFLDEYLADGLVMTKDINKEARRRGITYPTLDRAARRRGVIRTRLEDLRDKPWAWCLPPGATPSDDEAGAATHQDATHQNHDE